MAVFLCDEGVPFIILSRIGYDAMVGWWTVVGAESREFGGGGN